MPVGLNGQPTLSGWEDPNLVTVPIVGTDTRLTVRKGWFQRVAAYVALRWHAEVEPLVRSQCYGFDYRPARAGGGAWSSHSTGYAIDLNSNGAGAQLWGDRQLKATRAQLDAMAKIKADTGLLWGGPRWAGGNYGPSDFAGGAWVNEYKARFVDPMHWDLPPGLPDAEAWLKAMCERLRIGPDGRVLSAPAPAPVPPKPTNPTNPTSPAKPAANLPTVSVSRVQPGKSNQQVKTVQNALIAEKLLAAGGNDGKFGPLTKAAYAKWQKRLGFTGADADGAPGMKSLSALGKKRGFKVVA